MNPKCVLCETGVSSIFVLLIMTVLSVVAAGLLDLTTTESRTADSYNTGIAAQYLAEATANQAMVKLNRDPSWTGDNSFRLYDNAHPERGSIQASIAIEPGNGRAITAVGRVGASRRQVVVHVRLSAPGGGQPAYSYDYAGFSAGVQKVSTASVTGLMGQASRVIPVPTVGLSDGVTVPTFGRIEYQAKGILTTGITGTVVDGIYYVSGNLTIDTPVSGIAVIYSTGNIDINAKMSGNFLLLAEGNITIGTNINLKGQQLIDSAVMVTGGKITVANGCGVKGSLITGRDLILSDSSSLVYDASTAAYFGLPNTRLPNPFQVFSWGTH